jgi:hypothetical protein
LGQSPAFSKIYDFENILIFDDALIEETRIVIIEYRFIFVANLKLVITSLTMMRCDVILPRGGVIMNSDLLTEAWARYQQLHEDAKRVQANYNQYVQLYQWLDGTRKLFPESFGNLEPLPAPLPAPYVAPDVQASSLPSPSLGEMLGGIAGAIQGVSQDMTLSVRRQVNAKALDWVERILKESGPLHFDAIVARMKEEGWAGYPIVGDDASALYNALQARARAEDRFVNKGENMWSLLQGIGDMS